MGTGGTTKFARQAARDALAAAQEELTRRTRANQDDLAAFYSAHERIEQVDKWLKDRRTALAAQAEGRRREQLQRCGAALRAMRDRGEGVNEIAKLAGITQKTVRELIELADGKAAVKAEPGSSGESTAAEAGTPSVNAQPAMQTVDGAAVNEAAQI